MTPKKTLLVFQPILETEARLKKQVLGKKTEK